MLRAVSLGTDLDADKGRDLAVRQSGETSSRKRDKRVQGPREQEHRRTELMPAALNMCEIRGRRTTEGH